MEQLRFLTADRAATLRQEYGTPLFVYDEKSLRSNAAAVLAFPNAFGLTARYAMKALPTAAIVKTFVDAGLHIDASSGHEAERALRAGVAPEKIQVTAQQIPDNLAELVSKGVLINACSLHQLTCYGEMFSGHDVGIRVNPGLGSGHSNRTNVGGPSSSFGVWHDYVPDALAIATKFHLRITRMHTHIGSGSDPETWLHCAKLSLGIAARFPEVTTLSLGGGYKVARMDYEKGTDLEQIGAAIVPEFEAFAREHGRELELEVEPGTFLVANAGALLCTVIDVVDTGQNGMRFIKLDAGMTEILRPSMYGAQHPIISVPQHRAEQMLEYVVVGHCCESGDVLTPGMGDPEQLKPRMLAATQVGDLVVIEGAGAYCSGMAAKNYNSFPECAEVLLTASGEPRLIRRRQTLEQMLANEL